VAICSVGIVSLGAAGSAIALVCHPDPPGTRTVAVQGHLEGYSLRGWRVNVISFARGCDRHAIWDTRSQTSSRAACGRPFQARSPRRAESRLYVAEVSGPSHVVIKTWAAQLVRRISTPEGLPIGRIAFWRRSLVIATRAAEWQDQPARLLVYNVREGPPLRNWPMPVEAETLDVAEGVALFTAVKHQGLFVMRLLDGRFAFAGLNHRQDMPQIDSTGVVFRDDLYKEPTRAARSVLKFIPFAAIERGIVKASRPIEVRRRISSFTVDGPRVAFGMTDPLGKCDHVGYWSIPWHYVTAATMDEDPPTCSASSRRGGLTAIAMGGMRIAWRTTYGRRQTLLGSTVVRCIERVIARSNRQRGLSIGPVAAEGDILAFAINAKTGPSAVAYVDENQRVRAVVRTNHPARQLVVDSRRVAVLTRDRVEIWGRGRRSFAVPGARAIALRANLLAVLMPRSINFFDVNTAQLLHSWRAPARVRPELDLQYGVVVLTASRTVFALDAKSGRVVRLAVAPSATNAQIEETGVVYRYNQGDHGFMAFVPFAAVERALR
jgi:hypothetical protein